MTKITIPPQWTLETTDRYIRQNMERAMKGDVTRGLVELITNSDDSYRGIEENLKQPSGKIRIEIERRRKGQSKIIVRDRAGGMSREDLFEKMGGLGRRTSGFEKGKKRRGLLGRGAKDVAAFGAVHFESIKDGEYNHLIIPHSLICRFEGDKPEKAIQDIRERLGIPKGNGTVVTIEVNSQFNIPHHTNLVQDFSRYYTLRDIFSNPNRTVTLKDLSQKREDQLMYQYPDGIVAFDEDFTVPSYPEAVAHLTIRRHDSPFTQDRLPYREGILIKSAAAIHDCTYFNLESEPLAWRFTGELTCNYIDRLILEYENREETNSDTPPHPSENPIRLLDPSRDGLIGEHPFIQRLYKNGSEILRSFIDELKATESTTKREVIDDDLNKKLNNLSKELSRLFENKLRELEETETTVPIDDPFVTTLGKGLHIIPPDTQNIIIDQSKTFTVIVKHYEPIDPSLPLNILSNNPDAVEVRKSPVQFKRISEDGLSARTTFTLEGKKLGTKAYIEVRCGMYEGTLEVNVIPNPTEPEIPNGLTFERSSYNLQVNKEKSLVLRLRTTMNLGDKVVAIINPDPNHPQIVIKGGSRCELRRSHLSNIWIGECRIIGRKAKDKGTIIASVQNFDSADVKLFVEDREPKSGINIRTQPKEEDYGSVRYKWDAPKDPDMLFIGAKHYSIRKYLGMPSEDSRYPGVSDPKYHVVLDEVIAEALAFRTLEAEFRKKGDKGLLDYTSSEFWFHKHFSDYLATAHKYLVVDAETMK